MCIDYEVQQGTVFSSRLYSKSV